MNKTKKKITIIEYFDQGSKSLFFYKNSILKYLNHKIGVNHINLFNCFFTKLISFLIFPIHLFFINKNDFKTSWNIINQLKYRRYQNRFYKKILAFFNWELKFLHFKISVLVYNPQFFLCADSAYFMLRWVEFCKKKKIIVIRDFNDSHFYFSILRLNNIEIRQNFNFNLKNFIIDKKKLDVFKKSFNNRLLGISENIDYVNANNPNNKNLSINSNRTNVLVAAHIFGDAPFNHVSFFKDFYEWINFFIKFFSDKRDKYKLIIKEHPSVERYMETGLLSSIVLNSKFYNDDIDIISYDSQIPHHKVDIVITGNGSIGHEYIFRKKPIFSTSEGFCSNYKGCFLAKNYDDIKDFFSDINNINKLKEKSYKNFEYNLLQSYLFHVLTDFRKNKIFSNAINSRDYELMFKFFDNNNLLDFIFNDDNINHYFVLKPNLVS